MLYLPSLVYWSLNKAKRDTAALFWAFQLPSSCMSSPQVSKSQKKGGEEREKKRKKKHLGHKFTHFHVWLLFLCEARLWCLRVRSHGRGGVWGRGWSGWTGAQWKDLQQWLVVFVYPFAQLPGWWRETERGRAGKRERECQADPIWPGVGAMGAHPASCAKKLPTTAVGLVEGLREGIGGCTCYVTILGCVFRLRAAVKVNLIETQWLNKLKDQTNMMQPFPFFCFGLFACLNH